MATKGACLPNDTLGAPAHLSQRVAEACVPGSRFGIACYGSGPRSWRPV